MDRGDGNPLAAAARAAGVRDERVLAALRTVPREAFVPAESAASAYRDEPIPLPHHQVTTQPSLVAVMVEGLALTGAENVLEIGAGYGYQTALLGSLARQVWSVEWWPDLTAAATENLRRQGVANALVVVGDGGEGLAAHAPYDAIVVAAAAPVPPAPLVEQLVEGGRLVMPVGPGGHETVRRFVKRNGRLEAGHALILARFVPLVGRYGSTAGHSPGASPGS